MASNPVIRSVAIEGEMSVGEDLTIDARLKGRIAAPRHELTIGPRARIEAEVQAAAVIVHGKVKGNITATRRVRIGESGAVEGDIATPRFAIAEGGYMQGRVGLPRPPSPPRKR